MAAEKMCFKTYIKCIDDKTNSKTRKRLNKKSPKGRYYGGAELNLSGSNVIEGTSMLAELLNGSIPNAISSIVLQNTPNETEEEEQETRGNKIDQARQVFQSLINRPDMNRQAIIQHFIDQIGVTHSTAVSYYERLAKEAGITGRDDDKEDLGQSANMRGSDTPVSTPTPQPEPADTDLDLDDDIGNPTDPYRAGVIRTVKDAHLIFKKRSEDGTFEELWIYNTGDHIRDEMDIRRDILAGTDIPPKKTSSPDGSQEYTLTTMGNAQYVDIKGLPN